MRGVNQFYRIHYLYLHSFHTNSPQTQRRTQTSRKGPYTLADGLIYDELYICINIVRSFCFRHDNRVRITPLQQQIIILFSVCDPKRKIPAKRTRVI